MVDICCHIPLDIRFNFRKLKIFKPLGSINIHLITKGTSWPMAETKGKGGSVILIGIDYLDGKT